MSVRLRSLQTIDWSHLAPGPIGLASGVSVLCGANGSGKSSALDALKAVLGARRFGQGRTTGHYLRRSGGSAAARAWVLVVAADLDALGLETATMVMQVTRRGRRFALLNEAMHLGLNGDLAGDIAALEARIGRERWRRPEEWEREVLTPLGITETVRRVLELPQGEAHRLLHARDRDLIPQLLSLMGHADQREEIGEARAELAAARAQRDRARRLVLDERARLLGLEDARRAGIELEQLAHDQARLEQELLLAQVAERRALAARIDELTRACTHAEADCDHAHQELLRAERLGSWASLARSAQQLLVAVPGSRVVAAHLHPDDEAHAQRLAGWLGRRLLTVVCTEPDELHALMTHGAAMDLTPPLACVSPAPTSALCDDPVIAGYLLTRGEPQAHHGGTWCAPEWCAPAPAPPLPLGSLSVPELRSATRQVVSAEREHERLVAARDEARREWEVLAEVDGVVEGQARPRAEVDADLRALERARLRLGDPAQVRAAAERVAAAAARLGEAEALLGEHEASIERLLGLLDQAEAVWEREVSAALSRLGERFSRLARAAGMEGEIRISSAHQIEILVREHPGRPVRSLIGDSELSGGWRAKATLIVLLAALTAGEGGCGVVLLDEHAAALDEERSQEVGMVFARLAVEEGLQFVLCLPTSRPRESIPWCSCQVAFLAPPPEADYAPPPLLIEAAP